MQTNLKEDFFFTKIQKYIQTQHALGRVALKDAPPQA